MVIKARRIQHRGEEMTRKDMGKERRGRKEWGDQVNGKDVKDMLCNESRG